MKRLLNCLFGFKFHIHEWEYKAEHGLISQRKQCKTCGKLKIESQF